MKENEYQRPVKYLLGGKLKEKGEITQEQINTYRAKMRRKSVGKKAK